MNEEVQMRAFLGPATLKIYGSEVVAYDVCNEERIFISNENPYFVVDKN